MHLFQVFITPAIHDATTTHHDTKFPIMLLCIGANHPYTDWTQVCSITWTPLYNAAKPCHRFCQAFSWSLCCRTAVSLMSFCITLLPTFCYAHILDYFLAFAVYSLCINFACFWIKDVVFDAKLFVYIFPSCLATPLVCQLARVSYVRKRTKKVMMLLTSDVNNSAINK